MRWVLPRSLFALASSVAMGGVAYVLGAGRGVETGALLGLALAFLAVVAFDARRSARLVAWLHGPKRDLAPRATGLWGEIAYRTERVVRTLEVAVDVERLRLSQFLEAMEASPNGVLLLDNDDAMEWCNARAADHFGLDPQRDRKQHITNLIRSPTFVSYLQAQSFSEPTTLGAPERRGSLQITIRPYGSDGNKLVLSEDQTERQRSDAMRRDFVANVSHELRTPLTVLTGSIETMRNLPLTEVERVRVIALMSQQADRMATLVGDLLALAKLEGSPRPPADRWLGVAALFGQVEAAARALSSGRHAISFSGAGTASVAGSETELLSAIGNLASNAVRYTPDGGRVDVGFHLDANGSGVIFVTDTGRGVAREHLSRLTERFYRVDSGRSRESGGTGLGLAIVKHVVQRHGGELDIDSEPGTGSTFRLLLPAARVRANGPDVGSRSGVESQALLHPAG